jgi:hypothetical protein
VDESVEIVTELQIRWEALHSTMANLLIDLQLAHPKTRLTRRELYRWQDRHNYPQKTNAEALTAQLQVESIALLGLGEDLEAARWRAPMTPTQRRLEVLNRRQMLEILAAGGAATLLPGPDADALPVPDIIARVQLLSGVTDIGDEHIAHARATATRLAMTYRATPCPLVRRAAEAHAYTILDRLTLPDGKLSLKRRRELTAVASDAAALAGHATLDTGRFTETEAWFNTALSLAREAGDRRLEAYAIDAFGEIAWKQPVPDHRACVEAGTAAAALQGFLPPVGRAEVFGSLGCERAALGDDLISGRFLDAARRAAALIPDDDPGWGWWSIHGGLTGWATSINADVHAAGRSMWLGRPAEAVEVFEAAMPYASPRRLVGLHQHSMSSYVALADPDRACASAVAALDGAQTHDLGYLRGKVRQARRSFPGEWATLPVVRDLDERLRVAA